MDVKDPAVFAREGASYPDLFQRLSPERHLINTGLL
jgi:hypothetical protein